MGERETDPNNNIVFIRRLTAAWTPEEIQWRKAQCGAENLGMGELPLPTSSERR